MVNLFLPLFPTLLALVSASSLSDISKRDATGDKQCVTHMCIAAVVNGSTVQYTLSGTGVVPVAWMGMGFGSTMANTPMVIMWANSDGSFTISQRKAPFEVMPTVDPNPPRLATLSTTLSTSSGNSAFVYTIPANSDTKQSLIWAFGNVPPDSSAKDAQLQQHLDSGTMQLDLTKSLPVNGSAPNTDDSSDTSDDIPLTPYQRMIMAHAVLCVLGFALFLPIGALVARYLRTFASTWYTFHWIAQFVLAGSTIIAGVVLAFKAASSDGRQTYKILDTHKKTGIILFSLYFAQCALGAIIHWAKPRRGWSRRPPQNYLHAVFGLAIIGLAMYQIHTGIKDEWLLVGRGPLPDGVETLWVVWCVVLPVMYAIGLVFLRKQYKQEDAARMSKTHEHFRMEEEPEYRD
ncbi:hypothetical protein GGX14DRAFT_446093 [Mycena pura]|uniref:CBD9-like protein n=1 Tax=Mycena pura TaxID=153505 RepID=A0AAD6VIH0_9AGAR|nr:hypothetical protein GGX14DRAFT_446093 [Mycena pura]